MFYYYGRKEKIINYYPKPVYDTIIEPFAGSAAYSYKYWNRNIILIEKWKPLYNLWRYLQNCSEKDILRLPLLKQNDTIKKYNVSKEEHLLISFFISRGSYLYRNTPGQFNSWTKYNRKKLSKNLYKIKHWKIILGEYSCLKNIKASWFIDPPYVFGGQKYKESNKKIDYEMLSNWCRERKGQTIVCENTKANWLDFNPLVSNRGVKFTTTEAIWTNQKIGLFY